MPIVSLPPIDALQCFLAASRTLNFRAAALATALSPAAFSDRIRHLEEHLGVRLFQRTSRSVRLTDAGLILVPRAEHAIAAAAACGSVATGEARKPVMDLVMGTRHELGMSWLLPALRLLRADQPWITFHLYFGSGSDILLRVRSLEIDCAVTSSRFDDPRFDAIVIHPETYSLVAAPSLLKRVPLAEPQDARNHSLIDIAPGLPLFRYFNEARGAPRLNFARRIAMGTIAAIRSVVVSGGGVAVLPDYYIEPDIAQKRLRVVLPRTKLLADAFRLVFRGDDPRRATYAAIAERLSAIPLT
jgi:DNA-binding transcriptional LysR family regulator